MRALSEINLCITIDTHAINLYYIFGCIRFIILKIPLIEFLHRKSTDQWLTNCSSDGKDCLTARQSDEVNSKESPYSLSHSINRLTQINR